jgi:hypothetical protein
VVESIAAHRARCSQGVFERFDGSFNVALRRDLARSRAPARTGFPDICERCPVLAVITRD